MESPNNQRFDAGRFKARHDNTALENRTPRKDATPIDNRPIDRRQVEAEAEAFRENFRHRIW